MVVPGNITEEIYDNTLGHPVDQGRDVPLQRDAVHTTPSKEDTKKTGNMQMYTGCSA